MPYDTEKQENTTPNQQWAKSESFRFNTYQEARVKFDALEVARKRIRARSSGKFDVVVYTPFKAKGKPSAEAQA